MKFKPDPTWPAPSAGQGNRQAGKSSVQPAGYLQGVHAILLQRGGHGDCVAPAAVSIHHVLPPDQKAQAILYSSSCIQWTISCNFPLVQRRFHSFGQRLRLDLHRHAVLDRYGFTLGWDGNRALDGEG